MQGWLVLARIRQDINIYHEMNVHLIGKPAIIKNFAWMRLVTGMLTGFYLFISIVYFANK